MLQIYGINLNNIIHNFYMKLDSSKKVDIQKVFGIPPENFQAEPVDFIKFKGIPLLVQRIECVEENITLC